MKYIIQPTKQFFSAIVVLCIVIAILVCMVIIDYRAEEGKKILVEMQHAQKE